MVEDTVLSSQTGLPAVFVRKEAKTYGTCKLAEGPAYDGRRITLIEDVITTGGAVRDATNALRAGGAIVDTVVCAIDIQPGSAIECRRRSRFDTVTDGPVGAVCARAAAMTAAEGALR